MVSHKPNGRATRRKIVPVPANQRLITELFNNVLLQNGATAVTSDVETPKSDDSENDGTATPSDSTRHETPTEFPSRKTGRKRSLSDEDGMTAQSNSNKAVQANTSKHGISNAGTKPSKIPKLAFDDSEDDELDTHKPATGSLKGWLYGVEADLTPSSPNTRNQEVKTRPPQDTQRTARGTRQPWIQAIGKRLRMKRQDLQGLQLKPVTRLFPGNPRFLRMTNDDLSWTQGLAATVGQETDSILYILESELHGLMAVEAFSKVFDLPADLDAKLAKGFRAAADRDAKEGPDETEDPDGDKIRSIEAKKKAKWLNTQVIYKGLDRSKPPINTLPDIFEDMVKRGWDGFRGQKLLEAFVQRVQGRELRVGTMCSGTECPVLALGLINDGQFSQRSLKSRADLLIPVALCRLGYRTVPFIHVLSCEIVPFKQAYIQRNFDPQYLFRDVTELSGDRA